MPAEDIRARISALMTEMATHPGNIEALQDQLRAKVSELKALGLPVPAELLQFDDDPSADDADDEFDNMPV